MNSMDNIIFIISIDFPWEPHLPLFPLLQPLPIMASKTTTLERPKRFPAVANKPAGLPEPHADAASVPFSITLPAYVRDHLKKAAGLGSGPAMARKILTDWSEANKATR